MRRILGILLLLATGAMGQTIFVLTNNYNDLNPDRDALSMPAGTARITATITDGVDPISWAGLQSAALRVVSRVDGYTNSTVAVTMTNTDGQVRWIVGTLSAGEYRLQSTAMYAGDEWDIFDRYLSVTSAAAAVSGCTTCTVDLTGLAMTSVTVNADSTVTVTSPVTIAEGAVSVTVTSPVTVEASTTIASGAVQVADGAFAGATFTVQNTTINTGPVQGVCGTNGISATTNGGVVTVSLPTPGASGYYNLSAVHGAIGWYDNYGVSPAPMGTNFIRYNYTGGLQYWTNSFGSNITIGIKAWAGGGGCSGNAGGPGGMTYYTFVSQLNDLLVMVVGQGGYLASNATPAYGGGGPALGVCSMGGGGSGVWLIRSDSTSLVAIAGGGSGARVAQHQGGGGTTGGTGYGAQGGTGGTQSQGGAPTTSYTNQAAMFGGGPATFASLASGGASSTGATGTASGGGGYYSGAGGGPSSNGGGGSGYVAAGGVTLRSDAPAFSPAFYPPGIDDPHYDAANAIGQGGYATAGKNGQVVVYGW